VQSSTHSAVEWISSLSPWPVDGFGLERMRRLLHDLGDPQLAYDAIHVVGTNGKSTTTRLTEALLANEGLRVGAYYSPHVRGWSERIRVDGTDADFERAVDRVRPQQPTRRSSRSSPPPRCSSSRRRASMPQSSKPGSADGTTRRTSCVHAWSC